MSDVIAKPVVKNKFWIVESNGKKVATIQAIEEGGFVYVHDNSRQVFPTIKLLSKEYNIEFVKAERVKRDPEEIHDVYGYPCTNKPHNKLLDVPRHLPIYSKTSRSKSFFCAGYYLVKFSTNWVKAYCPKIITLNRYEYRGPYKTKEEQQEALRKANG